MEKRWQKRCAGRGSITLDAYGHVTTQMQQASADRMDAYIRTISEAKRETKRENEG
ncbi:hypothetical protein ACTQ4E_03680 [Lawsonibacter sp. LCP25S3_G6]|uniref:hypothetical protein n=1 Tax=unclassified Lawsonibacter TaxID=2617946 RepID=UPI003F989D2D